MNPNPWLRRSGFLIALPLAKLILHLITSSGYGFFRDEFYYIACSDRLAFGYVDQPPFSLLILSGARLLFGDSLFAIRLVPAIAGALTVLLVGLMVRRLGGGAFAQVIAMLAALVAPLYLALDHFYSMNAFDLLFWAASAYLLIRVLQGDSEKLWIVLGVVLGLGLQNKISVLWLGFGLAVGLVLSSQRRFLRQRGPWICAVVAILVFLPHVVWQVQNGWPTLEFIANATGQKMARITPWDFLLSQTFDMNPWSAPLWLAGLVFFLVLRRGRGVRSLGWAYIVIFLLLALSTTSRSGYLAPAYSWLYAGGGVVLERLFARARWRWLNGVYPALLVFSGAISAPLAIPILPVERYISYASALGHAPSTAERKEIGALPQFYADMHGWEDIVRTVAGVYESLTPEEQKKTCFFSPNYGDAGAIEFLGRKYGLHSSLSGHNNFWIWGPQGCSGEIIIVLGGSEESKQRNFEHYELAATIDCGFCMPYENNVQVWLCRGLREPLQGVWPDLKHYD